MMARRVSWWATWVALATCVALDAPAEEPSRPNFVFVLVDDLRFDALGCTGHPFARTPNIDRLAREGATFRNAFVTTPLCSPSRASFLTGLYAHRSLISGPPLHELIRRSTCQSHADPQ